MNIIEILSTLSENNIDLTTLIRSVSSLFNQNTATPTQQDGTNYYSMPKYDFDAKNHHIDSTMQGTMHSTMQCIVPPQSPISSQNSKTLDFDKIAKLIQCIVPLISNQAQNSTPISPQDQPQKEPQNQQQSQILCLTKVSSE